MIGRLIAGVAVACVLAAVPVAATAGGGSGPGGAGPSGEERSGGAGERSRDARPGLRRFGSCAALRRYARRHAEAISYPAFSGGPVAPVSGGDAAEGGGAETAPTPTNVQEPGIDEPDIVKAGESIVFAVAANELRAVDIAGSEPRAVGSLALSALPGGEDAYGHQLLLAGDRLLVIAQTSEAAQDAPPGGGGAEIAPVYYGPPETVIAELDVSDPAAMAVVRSLRVEGAYVSARLAGASARLVVSSYPDYPVPAADRGRPADLVPSAEVADHAAGTSESRRLLPCRQIRRPRSFSGLEMLSVLTIDLAEGLDPVDVDTITTQGQIVYASADSLYVATERWLPPDAAKRQVSSVTTAIHRFVLESPRETAYVASGEVDGFMLSQWAMSERDGLLRVASTAESPDFDFDGRQSQVTVLGQSGDRLREVGRVGGLGHGERIYAVRFIGDVGYVVTFRQVDPLYTIDLSDPANPRLAGELKVPGYSAYLHPVGEGLLLGVGQDATEQGRTRGTLASLFDVSELGAPASLGRRAFGEGSTSEVEYDHKAFLFHEPSGLAVIPLEVYGRDRQTFEGAVGVRVGATGIEEVARLSHPDGGGEPGYLGLGAIRRSLVAGDRLFTVSERGLGAHDLATLATESFVPFD